MGRGIMLWTLLVVAAWGAGDLATGGVYNGDRPGREQPLDGVRVETINKQTGSILASFTTGPNGKYVIRNLPKGVKVVICYRLTGWQPFPKTEDWNGTPIDVWLFRCNPRDHAGFGNEIPCCRPAGGTSPREAEGNKQ